MAENNANVTLWKDRKHWMWFPFSFTKYEIRNERVYIEKGLLKTTFDETLLYRVTDIQLVITLAQKIFGTGTITLCTKVDANHDIQLENIKNPRQVKEMLSEMVEEIRARRNLVGKEFYSGDGEHFHDAEFDGPDDFDGE